MTKEEAREAIKEAYGNSEYTDEIIKALEQEPCEDEYIKVPKNALKYRTAGMVAYNAEWLKNHIDIERSVICGVQEPCDVFDGYGNYKYPSDVELTEPNTATSMPCEDVISRQEVWFKLTNGAYDGETTEQFIDRIAKEIESAPPVNPQSKTGHWIHLAASDDCSECGWSTGRYNSPSKYCPNCGVKMINVPDTNIENTSEISTGSDSKESEGQGMLLTIIKYDGTSRQIECKSFEFRCNQVTNWIKMKKADGSEALLRDVCVIKTWTGNESKGMTECRKCGFNDEDHGCTCPDSYKWYACPIENKKPENKQKLKDYADFLEEARVRAESEE